ALTDPLTGLLNRRAMDELARFELKRHARYPSPLSLGFVDVDHFKAVNTEHLLTGGDAVLRWLARVLTSSVREVDSVGRAGGGGGGGGRGGWWWGGRGGRRGPGPWPSASGPRWPPGRRSTAGGASA